MYRVVLVDDEHMIIEGLSRVVPVVRDYGERDVRAQGHEFALSAAECDDASRGDEILRSRVEFVFLEFAHLEVRIAAFLVEAPEF